MSVSVEPSGGGGGQKSVDVDINLVPFIDMMSCLVAFLLITAVWTNVAQIKSTPKGTSSNPNLDPPTDTRPPDISILLDSESIWVGYGTAQFGAQDQRNIKKKPEGYDFEALGAVLAEYKKLSDFQQRGDIQVAAEDKVSYEDMIRTMDVVITKGFNDIGVNESTGLTVRFKSY